MKKHVGSANGYYKADSYTKMGKANVFPWT